MFCDATLEPTENKTSVWSCWPFSDLRQSTEVVRRALGSINLSKYALKGNMEQRKNQEEAERGRSGFESSSATYWM